MSPDFPAHLRAELLDDFYAEADEHLGNLRTQLAALEAGLGKSAPDAAALESLFRSAHSFKGISAMAGLHSAEQLAHGLEGFLRLLTRGETRLTPAAFDLTVALSQRLEQIVTAHRLGQTLPESDDLLRRLEGWQSGAVPATPATAPSVTGPNPAGAKPSPEAQLAALEARGLSAWRCTFLPSRELDQRGVNIGAVRQRLAALGEMVSATPSVRPGGVMAFEFVVGTHAPPTDLPAWERDALTWQAIEKPTAPAPSPATAVTASSPAAAANQPSLFIAPSHIVRIDLARLDELMRITGELVIHRSRLEERLSQLRGDTSAVQEVNLALARSLRQLRSAITRVRLVPIAEIFTRMPFVVRDLARETGKHARLVVEGQQTEIDKYLVERLKEPLLHLVRNAFSHGVETPAERSAAGKPVEATITLRAGAAGEFVVIQIGDDGRGIVPAAVAAHARAAGLAVPEPLDAVGLLALLCTPGFSTRAEADRAAGRGVGMAVVHNTVRELGGSLTLETSEGRGTRFSLRLPLTLSIAETIIVSAADQTCAVPQGFVDEIVEVPESEVRTVRQAEVIPYRDGVLPLVRLRAMFGAAPSPKGQAAVLVLSSDRGSIGLVVDRVHTQREVVVRPMSDPLLQVPGVSGATELGDGRPVLILDAQALTSGVVRPRSTARAAETPAPVSA